MQPRYSRVQTANFVEIGQGLGFILCLRTWRVYSALYGMPINMVGLSMSIMEPMFAVYLFTAGLHVCNKLFSIHMLISHQLITSSVWRHWFLSCKRGCIHPAAWRMTLITAHLSRSATTQSTFNVDARTHARVHAHPHTCEPHPYQPTHAHACTHTHIQRQTDGRKKYPEADWWLFLLQWPDQKLEKQ